MIEIIGKHNTAKVYIQDLEETARKQIEAMCNSEVFAESNIAIMPDVHAGAGCTIGTTMTLIDKVVPNMVGVDIGCGMEVVRIAEKDLDFNMLDKIIRNEIPSGREVRRYEHPNARKVNLIDLRCYSHIKKIKEEYKAIGSLGGGNHFIEVDKDENGNLYVVIHSGSRHLGKSIAEYYQEQAFKQTNAYMDYDVANMISTLKEHGREREIQAELNKIKIQLNSQTSKELSYCSGKLFEDYIHDMKIMQNFADINRKTMMEIILEKLNLTPIECFTTIHNYIDTENMILRKGAVSAQKGEKLLIPINMRDGSLICIGKGNSEWNHSAPHGAGRVCGRKEAKRRFDIEEFKKEMNGVYSTTISENTLDECPMAYKNMDDIINNISPTADILSIIKPVFNFKAEE
ncbi:MAG: RtcB family protein [Erysipelotrichaceae bacterium]|nr:RtcB family protein [Erysipelotrichaceae bacterium]